MLQTDRHSSLQVPVTKFSEVIHMHFLPRNTSVSYKILPKNVSNFPCCIFDVFFCLPADNGVSFARDVITTTESGAIPTIGVTVGATVAPTIAWLSLYHNCDRLRYDSLRLRHDYDEKLTC